MRKHAVCATGGACENDDMLSVDSVAQGAIHADGSRATSEHDVTSHRYGGNVVSMIQQVHVGGCYLWQGVRASHTVRDYAMREFKRLQKLFAM